MMTVAMTMIAADAADVVDSKRGVSVDVTHSSLSPLQSYQTCR